MGKVPVPAVSLAVAGPAVAVAGAVRAGRRGARAGRARLAQRERLRAGRSTDAVPAMDGRAFREHVAGPCRRTVPPGRRHPAGLVPRPGHRPVGHPARTSPEEVRGHGRPVADRP